jgi:VIT1/CCC1 family predicted Fe2+/Mn2+ transporter
MCFMNKKNQQTSNHVKYIKSIIYGGSDGILTTFAIVAGGAGAELSAGILLILGIANLFADGISMAFGDFISSRAEDEYQEAEQLQAVSNAPQTSVKSRLIQSFYTFFSFVIFGIFPLLTYIVAPSITVIRPYQFYIACGLTAATLFGLGAMKAYFTGKNRIYSGLEMLLLGGFSASAAYLVGNSLSWLARS